MNRDPKSLARERFAEASACLSSCEIIERYATDVEDITSTLLNALRPERPADRLCELGFGLGWLLEAVARAYPDARLYGLDLSEGMVAHVQGLLGGRVALVQGDMERLPFCDETFDVVVTRWTLYFMRDIDAALAEIKRTLRPGGRLVAATVAPDSQQELDELGHTAVQAALGPRPRQDVTERFNLDSSLPYMRRHFRDVDVREWRGWLLLPDVPTLVHFWEEGWARTLLEGAIEQVRPEVARLAEAWLAEAGELRVTRHGGAFVGYKR